MYRADAAMPIKVRREGRRTTTRQANISDECGSLLRITTKTEEGWWSPIVGGEVVTIFAIRQMPANDFGLAQDFPYVVDGGRGCDRPPTLVESPRDLGQVVRSYGQDPDELLGYFADLATDVLG